MIITNQPKQINMCSYCGGVPIATEYGLACQNCGSIISEVRFLGGIAENQRNSVKGKCGFIDQHNIADCRIIGTKIERVAVKYLNFNRLNYLNARYQKTFQLIPDLLQIKTYYSLTSHQTTEFSYRVRKMGFRPYHRYKTYVICLYQMLYQTMDLKEICQIMTFLKHWQSPHAIRKFMMKENIPFPRRDNFKYYKMRVSSIWPDIMTYTLPDISRKCRYRGVDKIVTDRMYAAGFITYVLNYKHKVAITKCAELLDVSYSQVYGVVAHFRKHAKKIWGHAATAAGSPAPKGTI